MLKTKKFFQFFKLKTVLGSSSTLVRTNRIIYIHTHLRAGIRGRSRYFEYIYSRVISSFELDDDRHLLMKAPVELFFPLSEILCYVTPIKFTLIYVKKIHRGTCVTYVILVITVSKRWQGGAFFPIIFFFFSTQYFTCFRLCLHQLSENSNRRIFYLFILEFLLERR